MPRHGSLAEQEDIRHHDNDNFSVGAGNLKWVVPLIADMNHAETSTLAAPLTKLHSQILESEEIVGKSTAKFSSVYVISDAYGEFSKIGMANRPTKRLAQLQTGNPKRLFIHRLFWIFCERYKVANVSLALESNSHISAKKKYFRAVGEWFKCSPSDAFDVVNSEVSNLMDSGHLTRYCVMTPPCDIWRA